MNEVKVATTKVYPTFFFLIVSSLAVHAVDAIYLWEMIRRRR